jgi:hypothetical protein
MVWADGKLKTTGEGKIKNGHFSAICGSSQRKRKF